MSYRTLKNFIAIDPGNTTGYARFSDLRKNSAPYEVGEIKKDEFLEWLKSLRHQLYVVEDYLIRPPKMMKGYSHDWDKGVTLQIIGMLKYHAYLQRARLVLQQPAIKPLGYKFLGKEYVRGKPGMHIFDAIAHGTYFIKKHKLDLVMEEALRVENLPQDDEDKRRFAEIARIFDTPAPRETGK